MKKVKLAALPTRILISIFEEFQKNSRCGSELFKNFFQKSSGFSIRILVGRAANREKHIHHAFCNLEKDSDGFVTADKLKQGILESIEKKIRYLVQEADVIGMEILAIRNFAVTIKLNLP